MTNPYGPWATLINAGPNPQLSAFWRRRLTMLLFASQASPMLSRRNVLCLLAVALLIATLPTFYALPATAAPQEPADMTKTGVGGTIIPPEKAVAVMEFLESRIHILRWKSRSVDARSATAEDLKKIIETKPGFQTAEVLFDPVGRRYHIEIQRVRPQVSDTIPHLEVTYGYSFDGTTYRAWQRQRIGKEPPTHRELLEGYVSRDRKDIGWPNREDDLIQHCCIATGMAFMPPQFWDGEVPPQPMSRLLRKWIKEKRELSIVQDDEGVWTITTPNKYLETAGYLLHVRYDPTKGGVVTGARWTFQRDGRVIDNVRMEVELQKVNDWLWAPKTVWWAFTLDKPPCVLITSYDAIEVNPPVGADAFRLQFPPGTRVTDYTQMDK